MVLEGIDMEETELVSCFIQAALARLKSLGLMKRPMRDMPSAMRDSMVKQDDVWVPWKPVASTVSDSDLDTLERTIRLAYPPAYRHFLKILHFYDLCGSVDFFRHPVDKWRAELLGQYKSWLPKRIVGAGLIPFGRETKMDAGPTCFDTGRRLPNGDCPVVFWDHEWVGKDKEVQPLFSSSIKMFECLLMEVEAPDGFVFHYPGDQEPPLSWKKKQMKRFLEIDPEGAGGPGRSYWTCWGVNPDEG